MHPQPTQTALCCAGYDPSGGAGLLADIRVLEQLGLRGMGLCTALTAQNSQGVAQVEPVEPELILKQYESLKEDFSFSGVKIGMLGGRDQAKVVSAILGEQQGPKVMDPVLVSSSGASLLEPTSLDYLRGTLLPQVDLLTPNLPEAQALTGIPVGNLAGVQQAARFFVEQLKVPAVLIKGGHLSGEPVDTYVGIEGEFEFRGERVQGVDPHGTGCLLSSAILGYKLQGSSWIEAISQAKQFGLEKIRRSQALGAGKFYWF